MRSEDLAWLVEHSLELQHKYAGKWIAVSRGRVVGQGATAVEADEEARRNCPAGHYILEAVEEPADLFHGEQLSADRLQPSRYLATMSTL